MEHGKYEYSVWTCGESRGAQLHGAEQARLSPRVLIAPAAHFPVRREALA
jgi:hypothetical protein